MEIWKIEGSKVYIAHPGANFSNPFEHTLAPPLLSYYSSLFSDPPFQTSVPRFFLPISESSRSLNRSTLYDEQFGSVLLLLSKSSRYQDPPSLESSGGF